MHPNEYKVILNDVQAFEAFMSKRDELIKQELLLSLPGIIFKYIKDQQEYKKNINKFYDNNKSFIQNKDIVTTVVKEISADNPGMNLKDVLELSLPIIKQRISEVI